LLGKEAFALLDGGSLETLDQLCFKDPDVVEMFRLIGSMRDLNASSDDNQENSSRASKTNQNGGV